jgi:hypothetical protein
MKNSISIIHQLETFVNQKPGFGRYDPNIYSTVAIYNADKRKAAQQKRDFYYLVWAFSSIWYKRNPQGITIQEYVYNRLKGSKNLYITPWGTINAYIGQYGCIEYRDRACSFIADCIWSAINYYYPEIENHDQYVVFIRENVTNKSALKYLI